MAQLATLYDTFTRAFSAFCRNDYFGRVSDESLMGRDCRRRLPGLGAVGDTTAMFARDERPTSVTTYRRCILPPLRVDVGSRLLTR